MSLLIDGYNLLNAAGIIGRGSLEHSRLLLLDFLLAAVPPDQQARTTVVFDARHAPPGLPRLARHGDLTVRYADRGEEADDLIERLIRADSAPRQLTVVSSDHRVQRAARRRKAVAIDSDLWCRQLRRRPASPADSAKPATPLSESEVRWWLEQFGGADARWGDPSTRDKDSSSGDKDSSSDVKDSSSDVKDSSSGDKDFSLGDDDPSSGEHLPDDDDLSNPFPPGYGRDLEDDAAH